ncbi:Prophage CP4-57 integrase [Microbulbifer sp. THAF38]|nr:integrase arm-type DNA-binding domain-containing protein [Microbulbifer sp. THAF38]QFT56228.1 Prophage CP4-57 integrase [Microbulbifer sp. THAF38]
MVLPDTQIKQAKPSDKDQWLTDGQGLRLLIKPTGSKYWRLKYRFQGKQKTLALGVYSSVSLKQVRQKLAEAKQLLEEGRDPSVQKQVEKHQARVNIDQSFAAVAEDWWNHQKGTWTEDHANCVWTKLRDDTFPRIGQRPIVDLQPQDVIAIVRDIEEWDAMDVAQRVLQDIRRVCRYAVQVGKLTHNPAIEFTGILRGRKSSHRASLPREELPYFLKELELYQERRRILTKLAIQLLLLTFVRPGELRCARSEQFDFESSLWRIPGERMKMGTDHIVPLSSQALGALEELKSLTGQYFLLFPSEWERARPMSDNTMRGAIFKMGWDGSQEGRSKAITYSDQLFPDSKLRFSSAFAGGISSLCC